MQLKSSVGMILTMEAGNGIGRAPVDTRDVEMISSPGDAN